MDLIELDFEQARLRHIAFKTRLRSLLYGAEIDEKPIISPTECAVGKWIYDQALKKYGHIPEMGELEKVHAAIHDQARHLIALYRNNHIEEAREGLSDMELIAGKLNTLLSVAEIKIKAENKVEKNPLSEQLAIHYKELSELYATIDDLDKRIKDKNAEAVKATKEDEQSLRLAIEAADMGTFDWDLQTQQFLSSERLKEIFGFKPTDNVTHEDLINRFHPEDRHIREEAVAASFTIGRLKYEIRLVWPDRSVHWIKVYGKVLHDANQTLLRMYGTVIDTTEQKNILEDLKESETKFRLLADSMPGFVWTTDANGRPTYFSQPLYDFSGLTLEEIIHVGGLVHPDEREENIRSWDEAVATGKDYIFEHRYRRQDGEYRWQLSRAVPQRDSKGNIQMWIGTSTDIHDRKLFTDELEQEVQERTKELSHANNELLRSNSELAQFAYVASHDLQEPLRKIQTFASRIFELENDKLSDKGKEYFDRMQTASLRMQQLIKDLLSFSRINTEEKQFKQTDLNAILAAAQEQLNEQIEQKHAVIRYANLPVMNVIAYQFEQLFTNLINNSLKFSKDNVAPEIDISAALADAAEITPLPSAAAEKYYHLSIKDNGIGFEPEYNERIFLVFQRLHGNEKYQGTGIGLAICKRIVENHKGIITASGELGKGACFDIYIPAL